MSSDSNSFVVESANVQELHSGAPETGFISSDSKVSLGTKSEENEGDQTNSLELSSDEDETALENGQSISFSEESFSECSVGDHDAFDEEHYEGKSGDDIDLKNDEFCGSIEDSSFDEQEEEDGSRIASESDVDSHSQALDNLDEDEQSEKSDSEHKELSDASTCQEASQNLACRPADSAIPGRRPAGPARAAQFQGGRNSNRGSNFPPRGSVSLQRSGRPEADDGSLYVSNWGYRSNLIDQNGNFQRATTDLKNYIASYKSKYIYYFDLVNGRYPQYVRTLPHGNMEIWRMSFNVYASGFSEYIAHLGEIHSFYQMEYVGNELRWVYKDFNFYPNKMRYGFRVNSFDIADVHARFVKFICLRDNILKQFPYVNIQHKVFIGKKFEDKLRSMINRLNFVKSLPNPEGNNSATNNGSEQDIEVSMHNKIGPQGDRVSSRNSIRKNSDEFYNDPEYQSRFKTNYRPAPPSNRRVFSFSRSRRGHFCA